MAYVKPQVLIHQYSPQTPVPTISPVYESAETPTPIPDFGIYPNIGLYPLYVTFVNTTTYSVTSFAWDFKNNGSTDSTFANPAFTYNTPGIYSVKLTVSNPYGVATIVKTNAITVLDVAPVLSSPVLTLGTVPGSTATGSVSTTVGSGTLYKYVSTNSTESATTIKTLGTTQGISVSGVQSVSFSGLSLSLDTTYYAHYVQVATLRPDSNVVDSSGKIVNTAPVLSSPGLTLGTVPGSTATGTVTTTVGTGTLYKYVSTNATESAATIKASGTTQTVTATGAQSVSFTGLSLVTNVTYYAHYVQTTTTSADSNVADSAGQIVVSSPAVLSGPALSPLSNTLPASTASGTVQTDSGSGTLYKYISSNATETAATIKSLGTSQAVSASGTQSASFTGLSLTFNGTYYAHYVQTTVAGDSNVVDSSPRYTASTLMTFEDVPGVNTSTAVPTSTTYTSVNAVTFGTNFNTWYAPASNPGTGPYNPPSGSYYASNDQPSVDVTVSNTRHWPTVKMRLTYDGSPPIISLFDANDVVTNPPIGTSLWSLGWDTLTFNTSSGLPIKKITFNYGGTGAYFGVDDIQFFP